MSDLVVYTAIFGDCKDKLHKLAARGGVEFVAFVDTVKEPTKDPTGWELRPAMYEHENPRLRARRHKALAHELFPRTTYSMWLDGTMTPSVSPMSVLRRVTEDGAINLCTFRHTKRTCAYQEAETCIRMKKDHPAKIRAQIFKYRAEGYPYHNGLSETMVVIRRHIPAIQEFNELWWAMLAGYSLRDQLSFDYCAWKLQIPFEWFPQTVYEQTDFRFRSHW